jgi:hypothetical protein
MDFATGKARVIQRQIRYQLALAKRRRRFVNVAELALRLARKHRRSGKATLELVDEIALGAAKAGLPVYFGRPGEQWNQNHIGT